ncbi:Aromatic ring hydroxylase, partial [Dysosmobacter welbionis]
TRSLAELGLENKYQGYYATKMALWCYLLSNWDINNLKVNPNLTGVELQRAQKILAAAKDIYARGTAWNEMLSPEVTCTPDRDTAYEVTIDGKQYKQQVFTFWSKTWVCDYSVNVAFSVPDDVPDGTRIVDMNNQDITTITTEGTGDGYAGKFKILYPLESVQGKTGSVQLSFNTNVYKYAVFFAICQEKDEYGELQNYVVDTDPTTTMQLSAYSNYSDGTTIEYETGLRIIKYETGTEIPISGALFEVIGPDGDSVGTFVTNGDGRIEIPLKKSGNYTVVEREAPQHYMISEEPAQNVTVVYDEVAEVTFFNDPYGTLRIEKKSNTGMNLPGAVITVEHIESGQTFTATTSSAGVAIFDAIPLGAYRIQEKTAPVGWQLDDTVYTATVVAGETTTIPIINEELPGLRIIKYDRKNMVAMPNVTFAVYRDGEFLGNFKTDQFGEILIADAEPGTYRAFEVDTGDEGHILDTTPQEVELHAGDGIKELMFFNDM